MPSPFPGMDPFIEGRAFFPDFHQSLITYMREAINAALPPPYFATSASRVWVETSERHIEPDVNVLRPRLPATPTEAGGGVALAEIAVTEPVLVHAPMARTEERQAFLALFADPGGERLVALVEVLSRANKRSGSVGRELYRAKQMEAIAADVHLVEIDLLRWGTHTTTVPATRLRAAVPAFDYHVCVRRFDHPDDLAIYPWQLPDPLPTIALPLLPGTPDVPLNLGALLTRVYDTGLYGRRIDYRSRDFDPPLPSERLAWIDTLLAGR